MLTVLITHVGSFMPISLSARTNTIAEVLFGEPMQTRIKQTLVESISENIPFCDNETPDGMDRIRFSVMKLISENEEHFAMAIDLAETDWRDLFMAAGFAHGSNEHNNWFNDVVCQPDPRIT